MTASFHEYLFLQVPVPTISLSLLVSVYSSSLLVSVLGRAMFLSLTFCSDTWGCCSAPRIWALLRSPSLGTMAVGAPTPLPRGLMGVIQHLLDMSKGRPEDQMLVPLTS